MLTQQDLKQIAAKGISEEKLNKQLDDFKTGFPFLKLEAAASIGHGIMAPADDEREKYIDAWKAYKAEGKDIVKFVPASGAASRMFKDMFAFLDADYDVPTTDFEKHSSTTSRSLLSAKHCATSAKPTTARKSRNSSPTATTKLLLPIC